MICKANPIHLHYTASRTYPKTHNIILDSQTLKYGYYYIAPIRLHAGGNSYSDLMVTTYSSS